MKRMTDSECPRACEALIHQELHELIQQCSVTHACKFLWHGDQSGWMS